MGAEGSRVQHSAIRIYMIDRRGIGRSSSKSGLYPAQGIRPCPAAWGSVTVAPWSARRSSSKPDDPARPTAPPRPGPLRFAAKTFCPSARSGRLTALSTRRGPGPTGRSEVRSGVRAWPPTPFLRAPRSAGHVAPCLTPCCSGRVAEAVQLGFINRQVLLSSHLSRAAEHER